jgi:hypothetical protein
MELVIAIPCKFHYTSFSSISLQGIINLVPVQDSEKKKILVVDFDGVAAKINY